MTETVQIYDTMAGGKRTFEPLHAPKVGIYSCGPTVYDFAHIGNFRSFLTSDLLVRVLRMAGYEVTKVQNITDVGHLVSDADEGEDKILKKARLEKKDPFAIARFFEDAFIEDEKALRILPPDHRPRATEYIPQQIKLTQELLEAGFAYEVNGSVYFRTKKFKQYGALSKNKLEDLIAGARVDIHDDKEDPLDFALWKRAEPNHLMQWDSPWGRGFPGWHIECSAMSRELLGTQFDIHTGGEDNIFPHHECEIAQNEAITGKQSVGYWVHTKHLLVDGKKMSKSLGNFYTVRQLFDQGWKGSEIRFALMRGHYRTALNFSFDALQQARADITRLRDAYARSQSVDAARGDFLEPFLRRYQGALCDDLNVSEALAVIFEIATEAFASDEHSAEVRYFFENYFEPIFAVLAPDESLSPEQITQLESLIAERTAAKKARDFERADALRADIESRFGVELLDGTDGTTYRMK